MKQKDRGWRSSPWRSARRCVRSADQASCATRRLRAAYQMLNAGAIDEWLTSLAALASFRVKLILGAAHPRRRGLHRPHPLPAARTFLPAILNQGIQAKVHANARARFLALPEVDGRSDGVRRARRGGACRPARCVSSTRRDGRRCQPPAGSRATVFWRGGRKPKAGADVGTARCSPPRRSTSTPRRRQRRRSSRAAHRAPDGSRSSIRAPSRRRARSRRRGRHVDMSVRPGELCLIVGATGGGKSSCSPRGRERPPRRARRARASRLQKNDAEGEHSVRCRLRRKYGSSTRARSAPTSPSSPPETRPRSASEASTCRAGSSSARAYSTW